MTIELSARAEPTVCQEMADEDENPDDGPGLISLNMKEFGKGSMTDPLRHAVGMRNAQDQYKMQMWNSFPSLFQNTIFHGEQDAEIKQLRRGGSIAERLAKVRHLKEEGNTALKAASSQSDAGPEPESTTQREAQMLDKIKDLESCIASKERELKDMRQELKSLKAELQEEQALSKRVLKKIDAPEEDTPFKKYLEEAIKSYEKAAGLLRYVECTRPDWKNDDGSYKGIEDEHLKVDESAIAGDTEDAKEAREIVTSCYLNIALASQKLQDFDQMRKACDEVLSKVNPGSVKALYRRAQARIGSASALDADRDAAIQDLLAATKLSPQDKEVRALLTKLRAQKRQQETSDRSMFGGMFDRGEVVTEDPRQKGEKPKEINWDLRDPKIQELLDIRPGPGAYGN